MYNVDALEQYQRRENIRIRGVAEKANSNKDDGEEVMANISAELSIEINECNIQRAHRLVKNKKSSPGKLRKVAKQITACKEKNLKKVKKHAKVFPTANLTPLRLILLNYVKYECNDKFVLCHSMNGRIRMKKASGRVVKEGKDNGIGQRRSQRGGPGDPTPPPPIKMLPMIKMSQKIKLLLQFQFF